MKLSCRVAQDLLPLYHDGVCSDESKVLVEEHLKECADCKDFLHTLDEEITMGDQVDAAKPLEVIRREWKRRTVKALAKGFALAILVCVILFCGFVGVTQWHFIQISTHEMEVAEIYQLEDGRILYRLDVPDTVFCREFKFKKTDDGSSYIIPVCPLIETSRIEGFESYLDEYMMIDPGENNAWAKENGGVIITKWYIGAPGNELLIYEEGMELEPAPAELEARFGIGY